MIASQRDITSSSLPFVVYPDEDDGDDDDDDGLIIQLDLFFNHTAGIFC